jgi:uncharacterized protein
VNMVDELPLFSRRGFVRFCAAGAAVVTGGFASPAAGATSKAKEFPAGRFVDVHTHLGQTWNTTTELTATSLLKWMDAHDVAEAVVLPLVSPESSSFLLTTEFVLAQTKPHRDRLIPFCCIDPRTSFTGGRNGLASMLKKYMELGAKGFGEHKPGVKIDDSRSMALYEACGELKLPVLFHCDTIRNTDAPGLPGLEKMLKDFPQTTFIGHAPGWWNSISADVKQASDLGTYPKTPVIPGGAIDRLMDKYPNIYGDLSAGSGAGAISRDLKFGREFLIRRADRLLFGTDYLSPGQPVPQFDLLRQLELPEAVQAKVFRDNARRLLRQGSG